MVDEWPLYLLQILKVLLQTKFETGLILVIVIISWPFISRCDVKINEVLKLSIENKEISHLDFMVMKSYYSFLLQYIDRSAVNEPFKCAFIRKTESQ